MSPVRAVVPDIGSVLKVMDDAALAGQATCAALGTVIGGQEHSPPQAR